MLTIIQKINKIKQKYLYKPNKHVQQPLLSNEDILDLFFQPLGYKPSRSQDLGRRES